MYHQLRKIGLTQYEAKIYQCLLEYGRRGAKDISENSNVPPTAVYPNLKSLLDKKLIQKFTGETSIYEALTPKTALPAFVQKKKEKITNLGKDLVQLAEKVVHKKEAVPKKEVVKFSLGKQASKVIYYEFIQKSKKSLYILGWRMHHIGDKYTYLKMYKKLVTKKVDVRLIVTGSGKLQQDVIKAYKDAGIKVRHYPIENLGLVISDGKECKITLKRRDLDEKINIKIDDNDLSKAMENYFLMNWEKARQI